MNLPTLWQNEMSQLRKRFDRIFNDDFKLDWPAELEKSFNPAFSVKETADNFLLGFDLPGLKKEDINVEVYNDQLIVSGERKEEKEEKTKNIYRSETHYGSFQRSFTLPAGVTAKEIQAECKDGVLKIRVPKGEALKTQKVAVSDGKSAAEKISINNKNERAA